MSERTDQDISWAAGRAVQSITACAQDIASQHASWGSVLKPRLSLDGDMWCALYGENLHDGVAGFGPTPAKALYAFEAAMHDERGSHTIERRASE